MVISNPNITKSEKEQVLKDWFAKSVLDPDVMKATLGHPYTSITPRSLLVASVKLLNINRGKAEVDQRDSILFSSFLGLEDQIHEHINKDSGGIQKNAAKKLEAKKNLSWLHHGYFTPQVKSVIVGNSLTSNVDGINPMEHVDNSFKITKVGEGGIQDDNAIPKESRQIVESSFGFIDPVHVNEAFRIGISQYMTTNTLKGKDRKLYKLVKDKDGKLCWVDHEKLLNSVVKIPEV